MLTTSAGQSRTSLLRRPRDRASAATVRFYFDADVLGVAKVVAALRYDATYPGDPGATINKRIRPACPVTTPAVKDEVDS